MGMGRKERSEMNTETDTPETDDQAEAAHNVALYWDCRRRDNTSPMPMVVSVDFARKLERERDEKTWLAMEFAGDLAQLRDAIRNLRDVQGRYHTQLATERLFALLPESSHAQAP
jgi:hypothetical protein